jgi:PTS system ascorbate-specific IIA component
VSAGILLVSHPGIASALLAQARKILGDPVPRLAAFEVGAGADETELARAARSLDDGQGVLILVDLPGATPANLAANLATELGQSACRVVSGLSMPMLVRALNYRDLPLDRLCAAAMKGAHKGIMELA